MNEHFDGATSDDTEGAQHVEGGRRGEAEDGLALVKDDEGLRQRGSCETQGQADRWTMDRRGEETLLVQTFLSL